MRTDPEIAARTAIGDRSAKWNELLAHFLVAEIALQFILRREPVGGPSFAALPLPSNPTAHQIPVIRVSTQIACIEIKKTVLQHWIGIRVVREHTLRTEIELGQTGEVREVNSGIKSRFIKTQQRRRLIVSETIAIPSEPVSCAGDAIGKIEATARVAGIRRASRNSVPEGKNGLEQFVCCERNPSAGEESRR